MAAIAPAGTAFLVAQADDVWVCPSERVAARLLSDDGEQPVEERQLIRLKSGECLDLVEPEQPQKVFQGVERVSDGEDRGRAHRFA